MNLFFTKLNSNHGYSIAAQTPFRLANRLLVGKAELDLAVVLQACPLLAVHLGLVFPGGGIEPGDLLVLVVDPQVVEDILHQLVVGEIDLPLFEPAVDHLGGAVAGADAGDHGQRTDLGVAAGEYPGTVGDQGAGLHVPHPVFQVLAGGILERDVPGDHGVPLGDVDPQVGGDEGEVRVLADGRNDRVALDDELAAGDRLGTAAA